MRIAQISDLHARSALPNTSRFPQRRSRHVIRLLEAALALLNEKVQPDQLIVTGDLVDVPLYAIERRQSEILEQAKQDYLLIRRLLEASSLPYMVLWGNHDDERTCREVFGVTPLISSFSTWHNPVIIQTFPFDHEDAEHFPIREYHAYTEGSAGSGAVVHVQHYVITPNLNESYPHTYRNAEEILERNFRQRVLLSLSGHYHPGHTSIQLGPTTYTIAAAFCEGPYPFYVYDIPYEENGISSYPVEESGSISVHIPSVTYNASTFCSVTPVQLVPNCQLFPKLDTIKTSSLIALTDTDLSDEECDLLWQQYTDKGIQLEGVCPGTPTN